MIIGLYIICMIIAGFAFFSEASDILDWDDWADYAILLVYLIASPILVLGWIYNILIYGKNSYFS